jgi:anti-sigma factor RsiW
MDHDNAFALLPGYLDDELTLSETVAFERHLAGCAGCRRALASQRRVGALLSAPALRFAAPAPLRRRIEAELYPRASLFHRFAAWRHAWKTKRRSNWLPAAAMALSTAALMWSGTLYLAAPSAEVQLSEELVDSHVRSLQPDRLIDVVSTDRHTVKPWFNGRIDFAPPVFDFAQAGYPLIGGRLDHVGGRAVAVMVYRYRLHPINLYVWPGNEAGKRPVIEERQGYHLAHWSDGRMNYWIVTDAGADEVDSFIGHLRARADS